MMALAIDPTDDPVVDSTKSPATLGNTMRSYILDANGAWLYQTYAMMGDPTQVAQDYGLPGGGTGFGSPSCAALGSGRVVCVIMGLNNKLTSIVGP